MNQPPDMSLWQGRSDDAEGALGRRWHQIMQPLGPAPELQGVALIGFACDTGVARNQGRPGAAAGPVAIRKMLANMPVRRCTSLFDAGDVTCIPDGSGDGLEQAQQTLSMVVADLLTRGLAPIVLGGGHEMAYGSFGGLARFLSSEMRPPHIPRIGIVNLDAHFDLRADARGTSGTPFRQIAEYCKDRSWPFDYCCLGVSTFANTEALFERARTLGVEWRLDEHMDSHSLSSNMEMLSAFLSRVDHVYFTVCLDVLPAAVAPGVSAPAARGVPLEVIEPIVDLVAGCGKLRLADIAELNPAYDIDQRTARVAARLVARIAEHMGTGTS